MVKLFLVVTLSCFLAMPRQVVNPKIACLAFLLQNVDKILEAGTTVVLTTGGIDELCLKRLGEAGVLAVSQCIELDLKRIAKASGGLFFEI